MGLLDLIRFKKDATEVFSEKNTLDFLTFIKEKIIIQSELEKKGEEKKAFVDAKVSMFIYSKTENCKNKLVLWLADQLIKMVPKITQVIYDFLKAKIEKL